MSRSRKRKTTGRKRPARNPRGGRFWKIITGAAALAIAAMAGYWAYQRYLPERSPGPVQEIDTAAPASAGSLTVKLFFGNSERDPMGIDCSKVYPVERRIPATEAVARAALEALGAGPTQEEESRGFFTSLGEGIEVRSLDIRDGVARVQFGPALDRELAGSCRVESAGAQIRSTLLQFPSVQSVEITGAGSGEFPLQP